MAVLQRASLLAAAAVLSLGAACGALAQDAPAPTAVTVVTLQPQTVTLTTTLPGRVVPSASAEVRPQVAGLVTERLFQEGSRVEEGDSLYTIDPTSYEAALAQAEASVGAGAGAAGAAEREAARVEQLASRDVASQQVVDEATSAREAAEAALKVAQAQLLSAQIELERTTIRAPISGEIGLSLASQGALVTASQAEPLTVIRQINPVYVDVTQSAAELLAWRRGQTEAELGEADRTVRLILADGTEFEHTGELTAAEPHVDEQTGVVVLRMEFPNPEKLLLPGMYVQVEMPTGMVDGVFLVPQEGVGRDRRGRPTAMVVNAENVVEERLLTVLEDRGSDWIVSEGLTAGDRVIVAGLQKTGPGATVAPEDLAEAAQASAETSLVSTEVASDNAAAD